MRRLKFSFLVTLPLIILFSGCRGPSFNEDNKVIARVGDKTLTIENARSNIPNFILQEDSISAFENYQEDWIRKQVILQEAKRLQIDKNEEVQNKIDRIRNEILMQSLKDYVLSKYDKNLEITEKQARDYYQENKNQFILNEQFVRFRHLITPNLQMARSAKRDLKRGVKWPEVAEKYSLNSEIQISQSQKYWPISMALSDIKILNTMLQRIGLNEISPIRRIDGNYHFVQLMEERAKGDHPDLNWLIDRIKEWLKLEKRRRHFNSYVKNLYLKAESNNEIQNFSIYESSNNNLIETDTSRVQTYND